MSSLVCPHISKIIGTSRFWGKCHIHVVLGLNFGNNTRSGGPWSKVVHVSAFHEVRWYTSVDETYTSVKKDILLSVNRRNVSKSLDKDVVLDLYTLPPMCDCPVGLVVCETLWQCLFVSLQVGVVSTQSGVNSWFSHYPVCQNTSSFFWKDVKYSKMKTVKSGKIPWYKFVFEWKQNILWSI